MTPVIFRKWREQPQTILALFPTEPGDISGVFCSCYEHVGQHGSADYHGCVARTTPATTTEYSELLTELKSYGTGQEYADLKVFHRATRAMHDARFREVRRHA